MGSSETLDQVLQCDRPLVIGHRGSCACAPENTLPSFQLALEAKADLVELDYHHSRDGVPVVFHDSTLDRTTNARTRWRASRIKVRSRTAKEIQSLDAGTWFDRKFAGTKVPSLAEALDFICAGGGITLIEHKSGDPATLVELLRKKNLINRVVIISFDWSFLSQFHAMEPRQVLGALGPPVRLADGTKRLALSKRLTVSWLNRLEKTGAKLVVWNREVSRQMAAEARRRGLRTWIYTVDDPGLAGRLLDLGVNGIITNDPARMRTAFSRR